MIEVDPNNRLSYSAFLAKCFAPFAVKRSLLCFSLLILFSPAILTGQTETGSELIQNIAEELAAEENDPEAGTMFLELLNELSDDPVKINSGDEADISRLFFLSDFQTKSLADYINRTGRIISYQEIAVIPGFDRQTVTMMIPFISLETASVNKLTDNRLNSTFLSNIIIRPGERDTAMPGSQVKILSKYKITFGNLSAGLSAEKDQGEKYFAPDHLPDFLSGYLAWSGKGIIREVIAGDFSARTGLGSVITTGMRTSLSLTTAGSWGGSDDIKPYTSTNENNFFRGAAVRLAARNAGAILFFSQNRIDATINRKADSSYFAESLYQSGLHNSSSLLARKDVLTNVTCGINLRYDLRRLRMGISWTGNRFSLPLEYSRESPENLFRFSGQRNDLLSFYYKSQVKNIMLFGEVSSDLNANRAVIQGMAVRPSDRLSVTMLFRSYDPGFTTFHGSGPGSGTSTSNEKGMMGSFTFEAASHLFISGGFDLSSHSWLRYRISFPSVSKRSELRMRYEPREDLNLDFSVSLRESMLDDDNGSAIPGIALNRYILFKGLVRYLPEENLTLSTRISHKYVRDSGSCGSLVSQDVVYSFRRMPLRLWARYCLFNTESWDSRIYLYENDLLYSFSVPAFSGDGTRSFIMLEYEFGKHFELRAKYSITSVSEDPEINDELKFQLRFWF